MEKIWKHLKPLLIVLKEPYRPIPIRKKPTPPGKTPDVKKHKPCPIEPINDMAKGIKISILSCGK